MDIPRDSAGSLLQVEAAQNNKNQYILSPTQCPGGLWKGQLAPEGTGAHSRARQRAGGCSRQELGFPRIQRHFNPISGHSPDASQLKSYGSSGMLWAEDGALQLSLGVCFTWHCALPLSLAPLRTVLQIPLAK